MFIIARASERAAVPRRTLFHIPADQAGEVRNYRAGR
jgi:hypothetical protein